jgi:hypothetical protein
MQMKMSKTIVAAMAVVFSISAMASGEIVLNFTVKGLSDSNGELLPVGSLVLLVADADGDNPDFNDYQISDDSFLGDPEDAILGKMEITQPLFFADQYLSGTVQWSNEEMSTHTGDSLALIWFDLEKSVADLDGGPGEGVAYGVLHSKEKLGTDVAATSLVVPADPSNLDIMIQGDLQASLAQAGALNASYVTVPEPASMLILALGGGAALLRRRRNG